MAVEPNFESGASMAHEFENSAPVAQDSAPGSRSSLSEICLSKGVFGVLSFVKSALTVNPGMSQIEHLYLQGEDRLLINFSGDCISSSSSSGGKNGGNNSKTRAYKSPEVVPPLGNNKNWVVIPVPDTYLATNWPIR